VQQAACEGASARLRVDLSQAACPFLFDQIACVLIEVPVMLSVVAIVNATQRWYEHRPGSASA